MKLFALTGIAKRVVTDLLEWGIRTVEIHSANNLGAILQLKAGDLVFITTASKQDVVTGTEGIVAKIKTLQTMMHRLTYLGEHTEENETTVARIQFEVEGLARVMTTEDKGLGKELLVDLREVKKHLEAF